jgi:hypothetical protein
MITVFKNLFDKKPFYTKENSVFNAIKEGGKHKDIIKQIRNAKDKEERDELKKQLGVVLWSGKFSERRSNALVEYSHLICLDFDKINPKLTKDFLKTKPFVYACFESPGGDGVKAIIKVSSLKHDGHFKALAKEFPNIDQSGKDVSRACFISHDPDLYINPGSDIYTKIIENVYTIDQRYEKLKLWLSNKGEQFVSGNRNTFLAKLSGACNRFGIPADYTLDALKRDFVDGTSDFSVREAEAVVRNIYTNYAHQFDIASFEDAIDEQKFVDDVFSVEIQTHDIIMVEDVIIDLMNDYDNGTPKGATTHFPQFDDHFRFMKGEITTMTGLPNMGKSTALTQMLLARAAFDNEKFVFLSMEQYPPVFFYKELARSVLGKPIEKYYPDRMTREEYQLALEWIDQHFFFVYPEKADPTPEWTLGRFYEAIVKYGVDGCVVDPYNSQTHDYGGSKGRDDRYIADMLNKSQRFALTNNVYYFTVAHPRNIGKNEKGFYKEPTADEISGGGAWYQRNDNILIYHRPSMPIDYRDPLCTMRSAKIKKQMSNGKPGVVEWMYDDKIGRFFENGYNPLTKFKL